MLLWSALPAFDATHAFVHGVHTGSTGGTLPMLIQRGTSASLDQPARHDPLHQRAKLIDFSPKCRDFLQTGGCYYLGERLAHTSPVMS
jgi:hypothetical protein